VVLAAGFGYYYFESSGTVNGLNQTISSQQTQIDSQVQQLAIDQARISNYTSTISSLRSQVTALQSQVNVDQAKITRLTQQAADANMTISSLTSQISTLESNITGLDTQISALNDQIQALNSQLAATQTQVTQLEGTLSVLNSALAASTAQLLDSNDAFSVPAGSQKTLQFTTGANGGFLLIGILSSSSANTTVSVKTPNDPVNVGRSGVAAFTLAGSSLYTVYIYDTNNQSFSATLNAWYFHS